MKTGELKRKIVYRKILLNTLLLILKPTNRFVVYVSQDLDNFITIYQHNLYVKHIKHTNKTKRKLSTRIVA